MPTNVFGYTTKAMKSRSEILFVDSFFNMFYQRNNFHIFNCERFLFCRFTYDRPYSREPRDAENEFASQWLERNTVWTSQSFPGIMSWFPVVRQSVEQVRKTIKVGIHLKLCERLVTACCCTLGEAHNPCDRRTRKKESGFTRIDS